jgi:5-methylcytosine-specific restriction endonuclease McrBC regulatory subunit McrC
MKQTAVDFLISHLQKSKHWQRVLNEVSQMSTIQFDLIKEANKMFEEQIEDAYKFGLSDEYVIGSERYYNETFKSEQDERKIRPT